MVFLKMISRGMILFQGNFPFRVDLAIGLIIMTYLISLKENSLSQSIIHSFRTEKIYKDLIINNRMKGFQEEEESLNFNLNILKNKINFRQGIHNS